MVLSIYKEILDELALDITAKGFTYNGHRLCAFALLLICHMF